MPSVVDTPSRKGRDSLIKKRMKRIKHRKLSRLSDCRSFSGLAPLSDRVAMLIRGILRNPDGSGGPLLLGGSAGADPSSDSQNDAQQDAESIFFTMQHVRLFVGSEAVDQGLGTLYLSTRYSFSRFSLCVCFLLHSLRGFQSNLAIFFSLHSSEMCTG